MYYVKPLQNISRVGWGARRCGCRAYGGNSRTSALRQPAYTAPSLWAAPPRPLVLLGVFRRCGGGQGVSPLHSRSSSEGQRGADDICPPCGGRIMYDVDEGALLSRARHILAAAPLRYTRRRKRRKPLTSRRALKKPPCNRGEISRFYISVVSGMPQKQQLLAVFVGFCVLTIKVY